MFAAPQCALLPDGRRLHLNHGPIDLIVEAFGSQSEIDAAYDQAEEQFSHILNRLVAELEVLRKPVIAPRWVPDGPVARRMVNACWPHRRGFVTPMAAVAGSVADDMLAALTDGRDLERAYVNNGGDIAFYLTPGASLTAGLVGDYHLPSIDATCELAYGQPVRGIATSGWKGRSHSLGIADSVTVLAETAAAADVAATLIANAVVADDPAIERAPASDLDPDSDLGNRPVTISVGLLDDRTVRAALDSGIKAAKIMQRAGLITAVVLVLQQQFRTVGSLPAGLIEEHAA
jgi:ApbE superfamily uncharacterized protein (UPF0280 family)